MRNPKFVDFLMKNRRIGITKVLEQITQSRYHIIFTMLNIEEMIFVFRPILELRSKGLRE